MNKEKIEKLNNWKIPIYEPGLEELLIKNVKEQRLEFTTNKELCIDCSDVLFICVNTPPKQLSGDLRKADLSYVEQAARDIATQMNGYKVIVDKSTVPIRTGEKVYETLRKLNPKYEFDVVSNPEFLREGKAVEDSLSPDRIVIGVMRDEQGKLLEKPLKKMKELYWNFESPIIETDIWSAELMKLASNAYLANQISFINKIGELCAATGADVNEVAKGMKLDRRIGQYAFLNAGIGFGGSCFPKDIESLYNIMVEKQINPEFLKQILEVNKSQKFYFLKMVEEAMWTIRDKKIAALGLAFKPDTDDMREAPSVGIINQLHQEGAKIKVYDPRAMKNARKHFGKRVEYCKTLKDAVTGVDTIVLMTEWEEFKKMDLKKVKKLMNNPPYFFDGRNVFDPKTMSDLGFYYYCIGRQHVPPL